MPYYLEGMNLIEGQESGQCCGSEECKTNTKEDVCNDDDNECTWVTYGDCEWEECTRNVKNFKVGDR